MPQQLYNVADTLQGILDRKRSEKLEMHQLERQATLDELNRKKVESDLTIDAENAKSMRQQREGMANYYKSYARQRDLGALDESGFSIGTDLSGKLSPEMEQLGKDTGRITDVNPEAWRGNEEAYASGSYFAGTPDDRKAAAAKKTRQSAIEALLPHFKDNPGAIQRLRSLSELDANISGADVNQAITGPKPTTRGVYRTRADGQVVDSTGKVVTELPEGAHVTQIDRTPATPRDRWIMGTMPDPADPTKSIPARINMDDPNAEPQPLPGGFQRTSPTNPNGRGAGGVRVGGSSLTDSAAQNLGTFKAAWRTAERTNPGSNVANAARDKFFEVAAMHLANIPANEISPDLRETLLDVLARGRSGKKDPRSTSEIVEAHKGVFDDLELAQFGQLLHQLRD